MKAKAAAVILAAGKGVRMVSERAKVLHPLGSKPLLSHVLGTVRQCGLDRTLVVVGYQADAIMDAFSDWGVEFVVQAEQRGTGHALMQTEKYLADYQGEILVLPGDMPLLKPGTIGNLLGLHRKRGAEVTLLTSCLTDPSGYGRIIRHPNGRVAKIVEDTEASAQQAAVNEVNAGVYCFAPSFLFPALKEIKDDNLQAELYLTDVVEVAVRRSAKVVASKAQADEVLGVNSRVELAQAEKVLREELNRGWMLRGVTIIAPDNTYIDCDAQIGEDTVIHPGCHISGSTTIGKRCTIMPGAIIIDSKVGQDALLGPYCILESLCLPEGGKVAPFEFKRGGFQP